MKGKNFHQDDARALIKVALESGAIKLSSLQTESRESAALVAEKDAAYLRVLFAALTSDPDSR